MKILFAVLFVVASGNLAYAQTPNLLDTAHVDLREFAKSMVKDAKTDYERAVTLLDWLSHNFKWLSTDYKQRTVKEIIVRQGGNCFELAKVYIALLKELGVQYRPVAEINIHPRSERRQRDAEALVARRGLNGSVFGEQHNDHRWVEVYDETSGEWVPADPSVGVIGVDQWLKSRVWFGERWAIDTSITNKMIVPFAIFTVGEKGAMEEDRTTHYLITAFNRLYGNKLASLPSWDAWVRELHGINDDCRGAFGGKVNLHKHRPEIAKLAATYGKLREEFARMK